MSRANPGSTRTTPSTRPRSITSCISASLAGVAAMMNRPEPRNCERSSRLLGLRSSSIQAMRALFTSRLAAYPKISSCNKGGNNSSPRIRGSRNTWRNSLRMMVRIRCLIRASCDLLPQLSYGQERNPHRIHNQQQQIEPQQPQTKTLQEDSLGDVDEIP